MGRDGKDWVIQVVKFLLKVLNGVKDARINLTFCCGTQNRISYRVYVTTQLPGFAGVPNTITEDDSASDETAVTVDGISVHKLFTSQVKQTSDV